MTPPVLLLARFARPEDRLPALTRLEELPDSPPHDALEGHHHLAVAVPDGSRARLDEVNAHLPGAQVERLDPAEETIPTGRLDPEQCHVYLCMETADRKTDAVAEAVRRLKTCTWCSAVEGPYDLLAVLSADTFSRLDEVIEEHVHTLPGLARYRVDRVINLDRM